MLCEVTTFKESLLLEQGIGNRWDYENARMESDKCPDGAWAVD